MIAMDESALEALHGEAAYDQATTLLLRTYGPQLFGFIRAQLGAEEAADDAYSLFAVDVWRGMAGFRRQCSFRAWAYTLARNAARRHLDRNVRARRAEGWLELERVPELAEVVRSATAPILLTITKDRFARLRERLTPEDQTLLILRVDKNLEFAEIAVVFLGTPQDAKQVARESARLRQRFKQLKANLRKLAEEEGLLEPRS